jgi:tRNA(Ile)-lysidine synthase
MIRKAVALISGEPRGIDFKLIKLMMKEGRKTGWSQDLPGLKVKSARNGFFFFRRELEQESTVETNITEEWLRKLEINLSCDRWYNIPEIGLRVGLFQKDIPDSNVMWKTVFDRDKLEFAGQALVCRIRRPGDRIFFDKIGHKALKKVFQDKNITVEERKKILVFACGESVVWIPGISRGDAFLPKNKDSRKLYGIVAQNRG